MLYLWIVPRMTKESFYPETTGYHSRFDETLIIISHLGNYIYSLKETFAQCSFHFAQMDFIEAEFFLLPKLISPF